MLLWKRFEKDLKRLWSNREEQRRWIIIFLWSLNRALTWGQLIWGVGSEMNFICGKSDLRGLWWFHFLLLVVSNQPNNKQSDFNLFMWLRRLPMIHKKYSFGAVKKSVFMINSFIAWLNETWDFMQFLNYFYISYQFALHILHDNCCWFKRLFFWFFKFLHKLFATVFDLENLFLSAHLIFLIQTLKFQESKTCQVLRSSHVKSTSRRHQI